jgi:hypothetical protein
MKFLEILTCLLTTIPMTACAGYADEAPPQNIADFHYPKTGVLIVSSSEINVPNEFKKKIQANMLQMKSKGYYNSSSPDAQKLLAMKNINVVALQNNGNENPTDIQDTHMKSSIANVGLAFSYPELPNINEKNVIGYAAGGMWTDSGWTGIKEFFNDSTLGTCSFSLFNMALAYGNVRIGEDSVMYEVNKKAGTTEVYGSKTTGFTYNVSWYDNTYSHELECASPDFSKSTISKMIAFSNQIDKNLSLSLKN